jgi:hypothetical protein
MRSKRSAIIRGILVGKPEGKRTSGKPEVRWEDNIKMDLEAVNLAQDRNQILFVCGEIFD